MDVKREIKEDASLNPTPLPNEKQVKKCNCQEEKRGKKQKTKKQHKMDAIP